MVSADALKKFYKGEPLGRRVQQQAIPCRFF
jgi:hypothetical protein